MGNYRLLESCELILNIAEIDFYQPFFADENHTFVI